MTETRDGGCRCGAVRISVTGDLIRHVQCYCDDCRKLSGGAPGHFAIAKRDGFSVVKGAPTEYVVAGESGQTVTRAFCPTCGAPTHGFSEAVPHVVMLRIGVFDEDPGVAPEVAMWTKSAPPWCEISQAVTALPEGFPKKG